MIGGMRRLSFVSLYKTTHLGFRGGCNTVAGDLAYRIQDGGGILLVSRVCHGRSGAVLAVIAAERLQSQRGQIGLSWLLFLSILSLRETWSL